MFEAGFRTPKLSLRDRSDTFPGFWPSGLRRIFASLPLRGQRRHQTGFPIIPSANSPKSTLNAVDLTTTRESRPYENDIGQAQRRQACSIAARAASESKAPLQCLLLTQGERKEADAEVTALRLISVV